MSKFDDFVIKSILKRNEYNILKIKSLKTIISLGFDREQYKEIVNYINTGNTTQLNKLSPVDNNFEFLDIMSFNDHTGRKFIVTVYSNNALENDPQVIDIFSFIENKK